MDELNIICYWSPCQQASYCTERTCRDAITVILGSLSILLVILTGKGYKILKNRRIASRNMFIILLILADLLGIRSLYQEGTFNRLEGYMLLGAYETLTIAQPHRGHIQCAANCLNSSQQCLSFNYNTETEECQLHKKSPYNPQYAQDVREEPNWLLYYKQPADDWVLVFRAQAYNNLSPYDAWVGTLALPTTVEDGCRLMTSDFECTSIYRSSLVDLWDSLNVQKVRFEMYVAGTRVVNIRFDGKGSTSTSWFNREGVVNTGWGTFAVNRSCDVFTMGWEICKRTFYINELLDGCTMDKGWMVVVDVRAQSQPCICDYDDQPEKPAFLYTPNDDVIQFDTNGYGLADVLAIFIKW